MGQPVAAVWNGSRALVVLGSCLVLLSAAPALASSFETTKIEPEVVYRTVGLTVNDESVHLLPEEKRDTIDQLYARIRFERTSNFVNDIVFEPYFRTPRESPEGDLEWGFNQGFIHTNVGGPFSVTVGKKAEYSGTAFFYNPSDLLNEDKDLFDPLYQKEGKIFNRLTLRKGDLFFGLGFIPKRGQEARNGRGWLTAGFELWESEFRLQYTEHKAEKGTTAMSFSRFFGDYFRLHWEGRYQYKQRQEELDLFIERKYSTSYDKDDPSAQYVIGTRISPTQKRSFILEAYQLQQGMAPEEMEAYYADEDTVGADPSTRLIGRDYAFVAYRDEATVDGLTMQALALTNLLDESYYVQLTLAYNLSTITSIKFQPAFFQGEPKTEFGERPFPMVFPLYFSGKF